MGFIMPPHLAIDGSDKISHVTIGKYDGNTSGSTSNYGHEEFGRTVGNVNKNTLKEVFHTHLSGSRLGSKIDEATRIEPSPEDKVFAMGLTRFYQIPKATIITRSQLKK